MDHDLLVALKALADPNRLRIVGACADGPRSVARLAVDLGIPAPAVVKHLDRLVAAGLVEATMTPDSGPERHYALRVDAIHSVGRRLAAIDLPDAPDAADVASSAEAKILRAFFRDDRLTTIPSQESKRLMVIRYLCDRCFTEDRGYPEKEVNQRLALFHPDVATLRRAMVDERLMTRSGGIYRRATVPRPPGS